MLAPRRFRRRPTRILDCRHHTGSAQRRAEILAPQTYRIGDHHVAVRRVVIKTELGDVDHHALPRPARQHVGRWQDDLGAFSRQPHVHAGIGSDQLPITQTLVLGNGGESVFVAGPDARHGTHDLGVLIGQRVGGSMHQRRAERSGEQQRKTTETPGKQRIVHHRPAVATACMRPRRPANFHMTSRVRRLRIFPRQPGRAKLGELR